MPRRSIGSADDRAHLVSIVAKLEIHNAKRLRTLIGGDLERSLQTMTANQERMPIGDQACCRRGFIASKAAFRCLRGTTN
jgi:hypothetical protein